jgi:hypothetical protein
MSDFPEVFTWLWAKQYLHYTVVTKHMVNRLRDALSGRRGLIVDFT